MGNDGEGDRITEIRIEGIRTLEKVRLDLNGLTVLIGENGSGKSSIIEACEVLRKAATHRPFISAFINLHGGLFLLLRRGSSKLSLGVTLDGHEGPLEYDFTIAGAANNVFVEYESLRLIGADKSRLNVINRTPAGAYVLNKTESAPQPVQIAPDQLAIASFGVLPPHFAIGRMTAALEQITVHVPFDVLPYWVATEHSYEVALREAVRISTATTLGRLGRGLPNVYHMLRNEFSDEHWRETMQYLRIGLGEDLETLVLRPAVSGSRVALWVKYRHWPDPIPAEALSDGTLAYLAFVALYRSSEAATPKPTLLAFDEPDLHLHPHLRARIIDFLESLARKRPVLITTHSDRLLDALTDPAASVVLAELDAKRATQLVRPDKQALAKWLERYGGLGDIRAAGHEASIMTKPIESP